MYVQARVQFYRKPSALKVLLVATSSTCTCAVAKHILSSKVTAVRTLEVLFCAQDRIGSQTDFFNKANREGREKDTTPIISIP